MKRITLLFPLIVLSALAVAIAAGRMRKSARETPVFAQAHPPELPELHAPLGTRAVTGRVVDIEGAAVPGVAIYFRSRGVPYWSETDAEGRFAFQDVADDELDLALIVSGHPPRMHHVESKRELELTLDPPTPAPPPLPEVSSSQLSGRLSNPLGRSFWDPAGYEIAFVPRASPAELGGAVERRVKSSPGGAFALPDLAHGSYDVLVLPSWAAGSPWPDLAAPDSSRLEHGADTPHAVALSLRCGALEANVLSSTGKPLEGAIVLLASAADPRRIWPPQATDSAGRFRFLDLPPGDYLVTVRAGEAEWLDQQVHIDNGQVSRPQVDWLEIRKR